MTLFAIAWFDFTRRLRMVSTYVYFVLFAVLAGLSVRLAVATAEYEPDKDAEDQRSAHKEHAQPGPAGLRGRLVARFHRSRFLHHGRTLW